MRRQLELETRRLEPVGRLAEPFVIADQVAEALTRPPAGKGVMDRKPSSRPLAEELESLRALYTELQQSLNAGAQLQRLLCAPRSLERGAVEIASEIFPVRHLSGDFCKVLDLGEEIGLAIGDIAGKGVGAGLWLPHLVGLVKSHAESSYTTINTLAAINRDLCRLQPNAPMTALFFARLDPVTGEMSYCNAGLPAPLLLRRNGNVEWLREGGAVLGVMPNATFACGRAILGPGDLLIGYSDGISEAHNLCDEEFGSTGLVNAAKQLKPAAAATLLYSLIGAVQDFAGSRPRGDDLTLMVVRRRP